MYSKPLVLTDNTGNNAFSFGERMTNLGKAELLIPCLEEVSSVDEIRLGSSTVFEEIDHEGNLRSCTGLEYIYKLLLPTLPEIYIFDNHNHALYFWSRFAAGIKKWETIKLLHIDQHSDLKTPPSYMGEDIVEQEENIFVEQEYKLPEHNENNQQQRREYANYTCNVGNFILPFLKAFPFTSFERIKAEQQLLTYQLQLGLDAQLLLDIDLDFRAPEMSIQDYQKTIDATKSLIKDASFVTIATSPYFLDQTKALKILQDLLG